MPICALPGDSEGVIAHPAALGARAVPGSESRGFVEEEQLRIPIRRHHYAVPAVELKHACDPASAFIDAHDFPIAVMQRTAPVAHHRAASGGPDEVAEGVYAVLKGHSEVIMPYVMLLRFPF